MAELDKALMQELMNTFRAEAADHVQALNQSLLELERDPSEDQRAVLVQDAFRAAHSLKGAARAVTLTDIEHLAHAMETLLHEARDHDLALTADVCDVLYDTLDALETMVDGGDADTDGLIVKLGTLAGAAPPPEEVVPAPETRDHAQVTAAIADETIRVSVGKLDDLMAQVSELLVVRISAEHRLAQTQTVRYWLRQWAKSEREMQAIIRRLPTDEARRLTDVVEQHSGLLSSLSGAVDHLDHGIRQDVLRLGVLADGLQDQVRRVRMVPFQTIKLLLERAVRDVAHSEGKAISFIVDGADVEMDKRVLEMLKDPLLHLLRNAVGHGVESAEERAAAAKPATGTITLSARHRGSEVRLTVQDDGRGFDVAGIRSAARAHQEDFDELGDDDDLVGLAFRPGVSTAETVTAIAGRGVGLDVVRRQIETMQGRITVDNRPGQGASIQLTVPTSLAMTRGLLVQTGGDTFAIPLLAIEKIVKPKAHAVVSGSTMIQVDGANIPLVSLAEVLELPDVSEGDDLAVVMGVAEQRVAFIVDDVLTEQELAVKSMRKPLRRVRNVAGAALMGSGEPVVVLNPADLIRHARRAKRAPRITQPAEDVAQTISVLVVDDSITTRTLEKNILTAAGFDVTTATNGLQALERLDHTPVDIVVSDIQMPSMDGIALTRAIRDNQDFADLPIILVTSLESREDQEQGMEAGANAYIVKRGFDQAELLSTIRRLL